MTGCLLSRRGWEGLYFSLFQDGPTIHPYLLTLTLQSARGLYQFICINHIMPAYTGDQILCVVGAGYCQLDRKLHSAVPSNGGLKLLCLLSSSCHNHTVEYDHILAIVPSRTRSRPSPVFKKSDSSHGFEPHKSPPPFRSRNFSWYATSSWYGFKKAILPCEPGTAAMVWANLNVGPQGNIFSNYGNRQRFPSYSPTPIVHFCLSLNYRWVSLECRQ